MSATRGGLSIARVSHSRSPRLRLCSGGRGSDLSTPPPTRYSPLPAEEYRGRGVGPTGAKSGVAHQGAAALGYTSPRFASGHYSHSYANANPGPGAYNAGEADRRTLGSAASTSGRRLPLSTEERRLQFDIRATPAADHYSPQASARGVGQLPPSALHTPSAAFASASKRLNAERTLSPGPGSYYPTDGKATASALEAASSEHRPRVLRRSASFGSSSSRFKQSITAAPGPGAYERSDDLASPRRRSHAASISASFASTSARTQLPTNPSAAIVPGPGGYDHSNPLADYARPLRRSASFSSASERLKTVTRDKRANPPPGAYNPRMSSRGRACAGATQRYSIKRISS